MAVLGPSLVHRGLGEARLRPICAAASADCAQVCSSRYSARRRSLLLCLDKSVLEDANAASEWAMMSEGRLFWLSPVEWSLLLVSAALCGYLALLV
jgi:hypothetical protein